MLTTLHTFDNTDGANPFGGLVQGTDGNFYGTTYRAGPGGQGTVFKLSVGLGPFVKATPGFGAPGSTVKILGSNLTDANNVTFNGAAAAFTISSANLITATIPAGATTGQIQVSKPDGTVSSNVPFRVVP